MEKISADRLERLIDVAHQRRTDHLFACFSRWLSCLQRFPEIGANFRAGRAKLVR